MHNWTAFVGSIIYVLRYSIYWAIIFKYEMENDFDVNMNMEINI